MVGSEGARAGDVSTSSGKARAIKGGSRLAAGLAAAAAMLWAGPAPLAADRSTPSGLPVPRYVSLKFGQVNARAGPGDDHRLLWTYHVKGLPVQVVAETAEWRRICDPEHGLAWVHGRTVDGRRTVLQTDRARQPILAQPKHGSRVKGYLAPRALASLERCKGGWCRIKVGGVDGWTQSAALWGTASPPQCR